MKRCILLCILCTLAIQVQAQTTSLQKPVLTLEQQIKELQNPAWKKIHAAQMSHELAQYNVRLLEAENWNMAASLTEETVDTAYYNAAIARSSTNPDWNFSQLDFTVNYGYADSAVSVRKALNYDLNSGWWRSQEVRQVGIKGECASLCSTYTLRNYNKDSLQTGGYRTLSYGDFRESQNWNSSVGDYVPSTRSGGEVNENGYPTNSWMNYYDAESGTFKPGTYSEYTYNELNYQTGTTTINFNFDSLIVYGTRNSITLNSDNQIIEQLSEVIPHGEYTEPEWQFVQRISINYSETMMEQLQEKWDADSSRWQVDTQGFAFYTNPDYPDSSVTYKWDADTGQLLPLAKLINSYDGDYNLVEDFSYLYDVESEEFLLVGNAKYTYSTNGELVFEEMHGGNGGELFKTYEITYEYDEAGNQIRSTQFNFSVNGEISSGTKNESIYNEDGFAVGSASYKWDKENEIWVESYYYLGFVQLSDRVSQTHNRTFSEWSGLSENIRINALDDIPVIFNPGTIEVASGDTVAFKVMAIDTNLEIPHITVSDLPNGAQFDEETREFTWIVGEAAPATVTAHAVSSKGEFSIQINFIAGLSNSIEEAGDLPVVVELRQNYPNPFNPTTMISYQLSGNGHVQLKVYDIIGREVATLVNERKTAGNYQVQFDASSLSSGMYVYRLLTGNNAYTRKMMLIK